MTTFHDHSHGDLSAHDSFNNDSIADQLEGLLANPHLPRSWLVDFYPRDPSTTTDPVTTIRVSLSSDGHKRYPTDDEERQYPQSIIQPFALASSLRGQLYGTANVDYGEVIIGDAGKYHRSIANYDWFSREGDIYLGPRRGTQIQFANVAKVKTRGRRLDSRNISIIIDDYSYVFDRLLQENFYAGTGGLNGSSDLTDKARPVLIGQVDQLEPVAVDGGNFIYQIHDGSLGAMQSVDYVKDEQIALSFDADYADITTASPGVGEYSTSLAQGYIKLQSAPNGAITCGAKGIISSTYGYVDDISPIIRMLAVDFAGLVDPINLDPITFTTLATHTATMGWYFRDPSSRKTSLGIQTQEDSGVTIRQAMDIFHRSAMSYAYLQPDKVLTCGRITNPDSATADFTLDAGNNEIKLLPWTWAPYEIPVGRVLVGYRHYSRTLTASEVDSSIGVDELEDIHSPYRYGKDELTGNDLAQNEDYKTVYLETALYNKSDADALASEQLGMRSVRRDVGTIESYGGLLRRKIGQVFELTDDRLGSSPKKFVVVGVRNVAAKSGNDDVVRITAYG